jgi:hypothetical protein
MQQTLLHVAKARSRYVITPYAHIDSIFEHCSEANGQGEGVVA